MCFEEELPQSTTKFSLGFFERIEPHSRKHLFQDKPLQEDAKQVKICSREAVNEPFTLTQLTSLQVTSALSPPLTFTKTIGPEAFYVVTLETHQQRF